MEVVVLIKPVPEAETRLRPSADGRRWDEEGVKFVLAGYDESAVEQALLLKESAPGTTVRALSLGPAPRTEEVLRSALALGCDRASWIEAPAEALGDPVGVARALAAFLRREPIGLVIAGKQSLDEESGVVPLALAAMLGVPGFGGVTNLRWSTAGGVTFDRVLADSVESWESSVPIVIGLQQAWNDPRTAKLPNILKSRRLPIERVAIGDLAGEHPSDARIERFRFQLPSPRTGAKIIDGQTPDEVAEKLVRLLRDEAHVLP